MIHRDYMSGPGETAWYDDETDPEVLGMIERLQGLLTRYGEVNGERHPATRRSILEQLDLAMSDAESQFRGVLETEDDGTRPDAINAIIGLMSDIENIRKA